MFQKYRCLKQNFYQFTIDMSNEGSILIGVYLISIRILVPTTVVRYCNSKVVLLLEVFIIRVLH